jgi:hypothetical protein
MFQIGIWFKIVDVQVREVAQGLGIAMRAMTKVVI